MFAHVATLVSSESKVATGAAPAVDVLGNRVLLACSLRERESLPYLAVGIRLQALYAVVITFGEGAADEEVELGDHKAFLATSIKADMCRII